jgi:serine/threonine protein kinase
VTEDLHIRVGDFGLSRAIVKTGTTGTSMQSVEGVKGYTLYYAAPEIIMNNKYIIMSCHCFRCRFNASSHSTDASSVTIGSHSQPMCIPLV